MTSFQGSNAASGLLQPVKIPPGQQKKAEKEAGASDQTSASPAAEPTSSPTAEQTEAPRPVDPATEPAASEQTTTRPATTETAQSPTPTERAQAPQASARGANDATGGRSPVADTRAPDSDPDLQSARQRAIVVQAQMQQQSMIEKLGSAASAVAFDLLAEAPDEAVDDKAAGESAKINAAERGYSESREAIGTDEERGLAA